jgi:hypothetical protein
VVGSASDNGEEDEDAFERAKFLSEASVSTLYKSQDSSMDNLSQKEAAAPTQ